MTTFARIVDGKTTDVVVTPPALSERFHPDWLAKQVFVVVPDGTLHSAADNGNGTFTNPPPPQPVVPKPNNPGNPYFGKTLLATKDFWALIGAVLPADRVKRLLGDSHFLWIDKVIDKVETVDPDDKTGQFLQIVTYLVATPADDGKPLMEKAERDAIMAVWK